MYDLYFRSAREFNLDKNVVTVPTIFGFYYEYNGIRMNKPPKSFPCRYKWIKHNDIYGEEEFILCPCDKKNKKFIVHFSGYCTIEALDEQQAKEAFYNLSAEGKLDTPYYEVDTVERRTEE